MTLNINHINRQTEGLWSKHFVFWLLLVLLFSATAVPAYAEELGEEAAVLAASLNESLLLTFIGIFLIGLALNLTPCVYPMLAITVSIFGQQGESKSTQVFLRTAWLQRKLR